MKQLDTEDGELFAFKEFLLEALAEIEERKERDLEHLRSAVEKVIGAL